MNELLIKMKKTSELEEREVNDLITLKQQYWGYSIKEQKSWLADNIFPDDNHLLIYRGGVLLAYLNAINVDVNINKSLHRMLGIGNVCVDKGNAHAGVGSILMACINAFIKKTDSAGILLCKEKLNGFYEASNWEKIVPEEVVVSTQPFHHNVMIYDPGKTINVTGAETMDIQRNF